ncbi:MAG: MFS transporter [Chloroflexi bacterium]|nr:MFS transporter [Chloroflexota bacterium]
MATPQPPGGPKGLRLYLQKTGQFSRSAKLVLVHSFFTGLSFGVFRLLFNFYVLSLDYNEAFIGTLQTVASLAAIIVALPAAYLAEKFSQRNVMITTALGSGVAFLGMVLFPLRATLIAFRMVAGMAMAARQVAVAPFLMRHTKGEERQWVFSFNFGMMTTAMFVGNVIGGNLPTWLGSLVGAAPTATLSYQLAIGSMMLVTILATGPLVLIPFEKPDPDREVEMPWTLLGRHGWPLLQFFIPQVIIGLGAGLMQPFMNIYFRNVYDKPDPPIGLVFAIGGLSMAVAQFLGPPLADKQGKLSAVILTQAASIPFLITLGLGAFIVPSGLGSADVWFIIAGVAFNFRLALMNMSNPIYQTFMLERVPDEVQALAMSLNSISFQFGWFIMPQLGGWLQVRFGDLGFAGIFGGVAFFYMTAILTEILFFRKWMNPPEPVGEPAVVSGDR